MEPTAFFQDLSPLQLPELIRELLSGCGKREEIAAIPHLMVSVPEVGSGSAVTPATVLGK